MIPPIAPLPEPIAQSRRLGRRREATVAGIVDCLIPSFPRLDAGTRAAIMADVTRFVGSQISALPEFLRVPYELALTAFELLPVLRWGRPFGALAPERRAAYVALWSDARIGAMRNFVKLVRGCALLAYYDHPDLARALTTETTAGTSE